MRSVGCIETLSIGVMLVLPMKGVADTALERFVEDSLSVSFSTAALLKNDEVIKLGFLDFDPNTVVNLEDDDLGSEASIERRKSLKQFSLPLRWKLSGAAQSGETWLLAKFAYLDIEREFQLVPSMDTHLDRLKHEVPSADLGLSYYRNLGAHWRMESGMLLSWMQYKNQVQFNTPESRQIQPILDGIISNYEVELLMAEPFLGFSYNWSTGWDTALQLFSNIHYLSGDVIHPDRAGHDAQPEAWYWSNGLGLKQPLKWGVGGDSLWFRLARVDLGGDLAEAMGPHPNYYQVGIAWLIDTHGLMGYFENLGIGVDINYGSNISGGTLIFMYNFDGFR